MIVDYFDILFEIAKRIRLFIRVIVIVLVDEIFIGSYNHCFYRRLLIFGVRLIFLNVSILLGLCRNGLMKLDQDLTVG